MIKLGAIFVSPFEQIIIQFFFVQFCYQSYTNYNKNRHKSQKNELNNQLLKWLTLKMSTI